MAKLNQQLCYYYYLSYQTGVSTQLLQYDVTNYRINLFMLNSIKIKKLLVKNKF